MELCGAAKSARGPRKDVRNGSYLRGSYLRGLLGSTVRPDRASVAMIRVMWLAP